MEAPSFGPRRVKRRSSVTEIESLVRHAGVGAGFAAHDRSQGSDGDDRRSGKSWRTSRAWGSTTSANSASSRWKRDHSKWDSVEDGVLMSILRPVENPP